MEQKPMSKETRPRYDLIPKEFLDELASIFEEGAINYHEGSWKEYGNSSRGKEFLQDRLNHTVDHLYKYLNGDRSENHLSKVAWGCLVKRYFDIQYEREQPEQE